MLRAPVKYWRGQNSRSCCSSWSASMVKYCVWAEIFLDLTEQASCKSGLLLEMGGVGAPLVLEERFQMLCKGWWKPLKLEPFCVGRLESEDITCLAGVVGAAHVGVEKDVEVK